MNTPAGGGTTGVITPLLDIGGHLAVWPGLYFAGAYASAALLIGSTLSPAPLVATFAAGMGLYLLDRVKPRDRMLDAADLAAHPARHRFLRRYRHPVRLLAAVLIVGSTVLITCIHPANLALALVGIVGLIVYSAGGASTKRIKDRLLLKNTMPGLAIASLAVTLAVETALAPTSATSIALLLIALAIIVAADAAVCDLDDESGDRAHGTVTLVVRFGRRSTWTAALAAHALAAAAILAALPRAGDPPARLWLALGVGSIGVLWAWNPRRSRDLIDLRLPVISALAWLAKALLERPA